MLSTLQVSKSVADLSRQGLDLRTLLSPHTANSKAVAGRQGSSGHASPRDGIQARHGVRHWAFEECGFNLSHLQGVMAYEEIEEVVAQVRNHQNNCSQSFYSCCAWVGAMRWHRRC